MTEQNIRAWKGENIMQSLLRNLLVMSTGSIIAVALIVGVGVWRTGEGFIEQLEAIFHPKPPAPQVDVRSMILNQVQGASELTTAILTTETVVPTHQDSSFAGYVVGTTKLLYIAYGQVRAGVDLGKLKPTDVEINNNILRLHLPPPKILDSKIDVNRSKVYEYDRGFLNLGPDVAPQLQTLAEQETLKKVVSAACESNLLQQANDRAKLVVTQLLNTAGYKQVEVILTPPPPKSCS